MAVTNKWMEGTKGQVASIMLPPATLAWQRHKKGANIEPRIRGRFFLAKLVKPFQRMILLFCKICFEFT